MKPLCSAALLLACLPFSLPAQDPQPDRTVRAGLSRPEVRAEIARRTRGFQMGQLEEHEVRPAHLSRVVADDDGMDVATPAVGQITPAARMTAQRSIVVEPASRQMSNVGPALQLRDFLTELVAGLQSQSAVGYSIEVRQRGNRIATAVGGHARRPGDGSIYWRSDTRMHVASVSKLITAIAMVRALDTHGIDVGTPIAPYLPAYWRLGPNSNLITFRHLLGHRSGIDVPGSATDYITMKEELRAGVTPAAMQESHYENTNFGLMRILIPIINGDVDRQMMAEAATGDQVPAFVDYAWDAATTDAYLRYVRRNLFEPAGISAPVGFRHGPTDAVAYGLPVGEGWNSGNLTSVSGGAGWVLSTGEVLAVMGAFRRNGLGMPPPRAQAMMDALWGLNSVFETDIGKVYYKKGRWRSGSGRVEQSGAYFLPNDMELVVLVNSPLATVELWPLINQAIRNNIR